MLWVSELPGARWPPCADVRLRWTRHLAFIYIYEFEDLLRRIGPAISKMQTKLRETISPDQRLCICLRWVTLTNVKERVSVWVCVLERERERHQVKEGVNYIIGSE